MRVDGQRHAPAALPPGKTRYPLYRGLGGPQCRYGRVRKISLPPHRDSIPGPSSPKCVAIPTELSRPTQNLLPDIKFIFNSIAPCLMISMLWEKMLVKTCKFHWFFEQWYWQKFLLRHLNLFMIAKFWIRFSQIFKKLGLRPSHPPSPRILGARRMTWSQFLARTHDSVVKCEHRS